MIDRGFTSEVISYNRISLGKTENYFLMLFLYDDLSAYDIFQELKKVHKNKPKKVVNKMAYKNVHKRVKRLLALGLIEEIKKKFARNAKKYRLTNRGLFQMILSGNFYSVAIQLTDKRFNFGDNIIIKTILYRFIEVETIRKFFTLFRLVFLARYLRRCCEVIQEKVDRFRLLSSQYKNQNFSTEVESLIDTEAKKFIFDIIRFSDIKYAKFQAFKDNYSDPMEITDSYDEMHKDDPNYNSLFPKAALINDKKFIKSLEEVKRDFDKGSKDYLICSPN